MINAYKKTLRNEHSRSGGMGRGMRNEVRGGGHGVLPEPEVLSHFPVLGLVVDKKEVKGPKLGWGMIVRLSARK